MTIYTVKPGDTIDTIAAAYGINVDTIIYNNQLSYPYRLAVGQALLLSTGTSGTHGLTLPTCLFSPTVSPPQEN